MPNEKTKLRLFMGRVDWDGDLTDEYHSGGGFILSVDCDTDPKVALKSLVPKVDLDKVTDLREIGKTNEIIFERFQDTGCCA